MAFKCSSRVLVSDKPLNMTRTVSIPSQSKFLKLQNVDRSCFSRKLFAQPNILFGRNLYLPFYG
jgi:hypothetical protein